MVPFGLKIQKYGKSSLFRLRLPDRKGERSTQTVVGGAESWVEKPGLTSVTYLSC